MGELTGRRSMEKIEARPHVTPPRQDVPRIGFLAAGSQRLSLDPQMRAVTDVLIDIGYFHLGDRRTEEDIEQDRKIRMLLSTQGGAALLQLGEPSVVVVGGVLLEGNRRPGAEVEPVVLEHRPVDDALSPLYVVLRVRD
jgi:hypothetical protein